MKKVLIVMAALVLLGGSAHAQLRQYYLGPSVVFKGGVNAASIPEGYKTSANFNGIPDIGITFKWMFDKNSSIGLLVDAEYATYSFRMRNENEELANDNTTIVYKPQYITFAPGIYFSGVTVNLAVGLPTGINVQTVAGDVPNTKFIFTSQDMNTPNIEIRVGGQIPVLDSETGHMNIVIRGGYMLSGVLKSEYFGNSGSGNEHFPSSSFNPNVASLGIGINYLFDMGAL